MKWKMIFTPIDSVLRFLAYYVLINAYSEGDCSVVIWKGITTLQCKMILSRNWLTLDFPSILSDVLENYFNADRLSFVFPCLLRGS